MLMIMIYEYMIMTKIRGLFSMLDLGISVSMGVKQCLSYQVTLYSNSITGSHMVALYYDLTSYHHYPGVWRKRCGYSEALVLSLCSTSFSFARHLRTYIIVARIVVVVVVLLTVACIKGGLCVQDNSSCQALPVLMVYKIQSYIFIKL